MIKKRSSEKSERDIEQLLTDTIELLQFRLEQHQITIERYVVGQPIELYIDSVGLQQVIVNPINNAGPMRVTPNSSVRCLILTIKTMSQRQLKRITESTR